jgi:hypothetical protein
MKGAFIIPSKAGRAKGSIKKPESDLKFDTKTKTKDKIDNFEPTEPEKYKCCACGKPYTNQEKSFPYSQSAFFAGNNNRLPICNDCFERATSRYTEMLGSQDDAIKRMCLHWDVYVSESTLSSCKKIDAHRSRIKEYVRQCNLSQNAGKTYDTYLKELEETTIERVEDVKDIKTAKLTQKIVKFWSIGFTEEEYLFLQGQYEDWIARHECKTKAQEELFKNICITQLQIQKATQKGDKIEQLMNAYQNLLGSANIKPTQTNDNTVADQNTFGTLIKKWEDERPISDPAPEWKDVDGIKHYISVWFLGHLCKMMGIKNSYSQEYEDEIARYKVEKPEYVDEDDSENPELNDMFNEGM